MSDLLDFALHDDEIAELRVQFARSDRLLETSLADLIRIDKKAFLVILTDSTSQ